MKSTERWLAKIDTSTRIVGTCLLVAITSLVLGATAANHVFPAWVVIVVAIDLLGAVTLGRFTSRSLVRRIDLVQTTLRGMAEGCACSLVQGLTAMAQGDLSVRIRMDTAAIPSCEQDEVGQTARITNGLLGKIGAIVQAYELARAQLNETIQTVARASIDVKAGATQLADSTEFVGEATTQIARSIEEVARGTMLQNRSSSEVIYKMNSLTAVSERVASGAATQQAAADQANAAVAELRRALGETAGRVDAVANAASRAALTAQDGGSAVRRTIDSIGKVREAMQNASTYVETLDAYSREIGGIVQVIDEIASQTNLLALNAAIEAARSGEHGRGFAVVAAEVRNLAERSTLQTKEITQRIASIQQQIAKVVQIVAAGCSEVENSAELGQEAARALAGILGVVEKTDHQAGAIADAVNRMSASVDAVKEAAENVARVGADSAALVGEMQLNTGHVQVSMETIASVSEQTAAGAEEVSASAEEQSAVSGEMSAKAQELDALAEQMKDMVKRFTLDSSTPAAPGDRAAKHRTRAAKHRTRAGSRSRCPAACPQRFPRTRRSSCCRLLMMDTY